MSEPRKNKLVKIVCNLTGETLSIAPDYYEKKIKQYGSEDNLKKFYLQSKIIKMIQRGHTLEALANSFGFELDPSKEEYYKELIDFHKQGTVPIKLNQAETKVSFLKTDEGVKDFLHRLASKVHQLT